MKVNIYEVNAFIDGCFSGNPAAVCLLNEKLPDSMLQEIAAQNNLPATAFILFQHDHYNIRWFFPECEIPLCGHGSLAASHVIFNFLKPGWHEIYFKSPRYNFYAKKSDQLISLDFPVSEITKIDIPKQVVKAINCDIAQAVASDDAGIFVLNSEQDIVSLEIDFQRLASSEFRRIIFTAQGHDADFVSRVFYPKYCVKEDPVCGSAHCQLLPYWCQQLGKTKLVAKQLSGRGGKLFCELVGDKVYLSGYCQRYLQGTIFLNQDL